MKLFYATIEFGDGWQFQLQKLVHDRKQDNSSLRIEVLKALNEAGLKIESYKVHVEEASV